MNHLDSDYFVTCSKTGDQFAGRHILADFWDVERMGVSGGPSSAGSGGSTPAGIGPTAAPPEVGLCPRCQDRGIVGRLCTRCPGSIRFLPFQQAMDLIQQHNEHQQWMQEQQNQQ